jgi:cysteine-rich repeat protein
MTSPTRGRDHGGSEAVGQLSEHDEPAPVLNGFPKFVMPRNAIRTASTLQAMSSMRGDLRVRGDVEAWIARDGRPAAVYSAQTIGRLAHDGEMHISRRWMRMVWLVAGLAIVRVASAACLDDCLAEFGGAGEDYAECVADCGVCGNGEIEGDEECDDGNTAGGDCCDANCQPEPEGSPCEEDDELCTTDACDGDGECDHEEEPAPDCRSTAAGGATLVLRDTEGDAKDLIMWKWRRGAATTKAEFGDPTEATSYALCVYDDSGLLVTLTAPASGTCGNHACWTSPPGGFRYRDPERTPEGVADLLLQQGRRDGRTKLVLEATGENLDVPDLGVLESPLTVQLRRSGSPLCWGARYTFPPARRNDEVRFRDRSDAPLATTTTTTVPEPGTTSTTTPGASSTTTTVTTAPGATTTTTLGGASLEVTVVDAAGAPVADADVTVTYADGNEDFYFTDDAGVAVFTGQPVGVAATIAAEDDDNRTGEASSPSFAPGMNRVTVTVR